MIVYFWTSDKRKSRHDILKEAIERRQYFKKLKLLSTIVMAFYKANMAMYL